MIKIINQDQMKNQKIAFCQINYLNVFQIICYKYLNITFTYNKLIQKNKKNGLNGFILIFYNNWKTFFTHSFNCNEQYYNQFEEKEKFNLLNQQINNFQNKNQQHQFRNYQIVYQKGRYVGRINNTLDKKMKQNQKLQKLNIYLIDNRLLRLLYNFYIEKLHDLQSSYQRSYKLCILLNLIKACYILMMLFNNSSLQDINSSGSGFEFYTFLDAEAYLDRIQGSLIYLQVTVLSINSVLMIYIFIKFLQFAANSINNMKLSHLEGANINTGEIQVKQDIYHEIIFSFIFQTYEYIIIIPAIYISCILRNAISIPALVLAILNGLIIKDSDYNYLISSKDFLSKRYIWSDKILYLLQCLLLSIYALEKGIFGLWMIILYVFLELAFIIYKRPYFSKHMEGIIMWIKIFILMLYISCISLRSNIDQGPSLFFVLLALSVPISLKITRIIINQQLTMIENELERLMNSTTLSQEDNNSKHIDQIIRMIIYPERVFLSNQQNFLFNLIIPHVHKSDAQIKRDIFKANLLRTFQVKLFREIDYELNELKKLQAGQNIGERGKTKKLGRSQNQSGNESNYDQDEMAQNQLDAYNEAKQEILAQQYALNEKQIHGKIYIEKAQVYGDDKVMEENLQSYFHRVIQNTKDKQEFTEIDVIHLVYILEILNNEKLFELKFFQNKKKMSIKHQQIVKSLFSESYEKKNMHIKEYGKESIFHTELQEALSYDSLINLLQFWIDETIEKKLLILSVMRQRHIILDELRKMLEDVQFRRSQIIKTISHLVQLNDKNSKLHSLYICYLENLSFTDKDINLNKFKKQQQINSVQRNYLAKLDKSDSCVVFASVGKSNKGFLIKKITQTFERIFNYKPVEIINASIEKLMPYPYQKPHAKLIKDFFSDNMQNEKGNVPLAFGLSQKGYIIPLEISIRINNFQGDFGLSAYLQVLDKNQLVNEYQQQYYNYLSKEYLIYDESNLKVISMTFALHSLLFYRFKSIHSIYLRGFFPFLRKIFQNHSMRSSNTGRSKSAKSSNSLLQSSRYLNSNRSITSQRRRAQNMMKELDKKKKDVNGSQASISSDKKHKQKKIQKEKERLSSLYSRTLTKNVEEMDFLMIVQKGESISDDDSPQYIESNFQFFTMYVQICEDRIGQNNQPIRYLEITKIQEVNAFNNSGFLLNVFDDQINMLTNKQFFTQQVQNKIIQHLEKFYFFQQLIQNGEINISDLKVNENKLSLKNLQRSSYMSPKKGKYSNNEIYKYYISYGYSQLPEVINEFEYEKEESTLDNKRFTFSNQQEQKAEQAKLHDNPDNINYEQLDKFFNNREPEKAHRGNVNSQSKEKQPRLSQLANIAKYKFNTQEYVKKPNYKSELNEDQKQNHISIFQGRQVKLAKQQSEDLSFVSSQIDLQESPRKKQDGQIKLKNLDQAQTSQKQSENQVKKIEATETISPVKNQINFPYSPSQSLSFHQASNQKGQELLSPSQQNVIPQFNMDDINFQNTPLNSKVQHAVFGEAANQNHNIYQNNQYYSLNYDNSMQYLAGDNSKQNNIDSQVMSPQAAVATTFYQDNQLNNYLSQSQILTPSNSQGIIPQQYGLLGPQLDQNIFQNPSQSSLMNISNLNITNVNNNFIYDNKQIQNQKSSKFFSSKLNQMSQLKSLRSKVSSNTQPNFIQQFSTLNPGSNDPSKEFSGQSQSKDIEDTKTKKKQYINIQDAVESSSTHSKLSNISSQKKQVNHIIFSTKDLNAMKIINIFGFLSISVIIFVTLFQYYQIITTFQDFESDCNISDVPTRYVSNMAYIVYGKSFQFLLQNNFFTLTDIQVQQELSNIKQVYNNTFTQQLSMLISLSIPQPTNQLVFYLIDGQYIANLSSLYGTDSSLVGVNSNDLNNYKTYNYATNVFYGCILTFQYFFRFVYGSGNPRSTYIALSNQDRLQVELLNLFNQSEQDQLDSITVNRDLVTKLMVLILIICPLCVSIVLPLYAYIQTKRQEILMLFGTFSIQRLDQCMQDTKFTTFYLFDISSNQAASQKQNVQRQLLNSKETQKKQTLSSSTPLPKISLVLVFLSIVIILFTLPYPIANQQISFRFIDQDSLTLQLKLELSQLRMNILESVSSAYYSFYLKIHPELQKQYNITYYMTKLQNSTSNIGQTQLQIQSLFNQISLQNMFQQDFYNNFIPSYFEKSLCGSYVQSSYVVQLTDLNQQICDQLHNGILNQGAFFILKTTIQILNDYYEMAQIQSISDFQNAYQQYEQSFSTMDFNQMFNILADTLDAMTDGIDKQMTSYFDYIKVISIILMVYQFLVVGVILIISWIFFYISLGRQLNETKQLLSVIDIYSIVNNPYIHNFLIQNLRS
ncbi:Ku70/Ku80 beta-barrel domain protein, putative (macronuclear) [Tetrahymena thermophila SB210]|uniref:Ku70/Ku80 beta-barrel domain protein, putative n=1 Tax=Tetrahymena thermophila (strain SB210) TaxID=312017 RepID=I7LW45_TETTS|nr:Ku70/Ku80 beta-barrel domain protein, putative [Tetrahymena thermophila SB210]EAS00819.2 Ku70/Ku80 beta-barrel domain protein, putative [Tetrahymena thermophila SB210]|eukprot:XP_001021064.2 Ku70/Ku80 beta-barrel domain protein, putative [Tetrahymena thermophila SB210]